MPELPEVETTARGLRARLIGRRIVDVREVDWPRMLANATLEEVARAVRGRSVVGVGRRGKYLLLALDSGAIVTIHRKMSGNLLLRPAGTPREGHTHLVFALDDADELRFVDPRKFGRVYLFASAAELDAFFDRRLGPEPLEGFDAAALRERLAGRRGRIKSLLLDQAFVAGIGNLYADEALWEARIHPLRPGASLTASEVRRLAEAIKRVLEAAIARRGTSFSDYRDADGSRGENQDFLNVYGKGPVGGRPGELCPRCAAPIERIVLGQRSSHFCPRCQRRPAARQRSGGGGLTGHTCQGEQEEQDNQDVNDGAPEADGADEEELRVHQVEDHQQRARGPRELKRATAQNRRSALEGEHREHANEPGEPQHGHRDRADPRLRAGRDDVAVDQRGGGAGQRHLLSPDVRGRQVGRDSQAGNG